MVAPEHSRHITLMMMMIDYFQYFLQLFTLTKDLGKEFLCNGQKALYPNLEFDFRVCGRVCPQ